MLRSRKKDTVQYRKSKDARPYKLYSRSKENTQLQRQYREVMNNYFK